LGAQVFAQAKLEQESGDSDGRHDDQCEWTVESGTAGVDHHECKRQKKESRGNDAPAAGLSLRIWL
jgi:hypothetical protein